MVSICYLYDYSICNNGYFGLDYPGASTSSNNTQFLEFTYLRNSFFDGVVVLLHQFIFQLYHTEEVDMTTRKPEPTQNNIMKWQHGHPLTQQLILVVGGLNIVILSMNPWWQAIGTLFIMFGILWNQVIE